MGLSKQRALRTRPGARRTNIAPQNPSQVSCRLEAFKRCAQNRRLILRVRDRIYIAGALRSVFNFLAEFGLHPVGHQHLEQRLVRHVALVRQLLQSSKHGLGQPE